MDQINEVFEPSITRTKTTRSCTAKNADWTFLKRASSLPKGADDMLLESVRKYAKPDFKQALMARLSTMREETRRQAEELCQFAQLLDSDIGDAPSEPKKWTLDQIGCTQKLLNKCE